MNTIDCIKSRRSVRKFTEEKVPHEVLEQLVELARWAPSWKNTQIARYVAVEDEALKNRIAEEATIPWKGKFPLDKPSATRYNNRAVP